MDDHVVTLSRSWLEAWQMPQIGAAVARVRISP
jgi:hypothetical protein